MKKNAEVIVNRRRLTALLAAFALFFGIYAVRLFEIQIMDGDYYAAAAFRNTGTTVSVAAARGEILDRYMQPLAVNRTTYAVMFDYNYFPKNNADQQALRNELLLALTKQLSEADESWNDTLPISRTAPYTFEADRETSVEKLKTTLRLAEYATADNCMAALSELYGLSGYTAEEQRRIAGVQYEISIRDFSAKNAFCFSDDVSKDTATAIEENSRTFVGVDIQTKPVREYVSGTVGCHFIGQVGPIYAGEYSKLKEKGYALNDTVGRDGIEAAMEDNLRGKTGTKSIIKNAAGEILEEYESEAAVPGDTVILTIDSKLQAATQNALKTVITELKSRPKGQTGQDVVSGAAVLQDVRDGGILALASYPDFDLSTYSKNFQALNQDKSRPLFNRATNGTFVVGSTFKPAVATAALAEGIITGSTKINCVKKYTYYRDYQPSCLHRDGPINVGRALCVSCNYFFYDVSRRLGITKMNRYCKLFGFGEKTGIEIGEKQGILAGPEEREKRGGTWHPGDTLSAGIGQSDNLFTPLQLAAYTMTLANNGVRYKSHLVYSILSYDGSTETVVKPEVAAKIDVPDSVWETVKAGMYEAANSPSGTVYRFFKDADYTIAGKSGTAQTGIKGATDHSLLIVYAPAESPEVALSVLIERGGGSSSKDVARLILDAYFENKTTDESTDTIGSLLP